MVDKLPSVPKIPFQHHQGFERVKNLEENQAIFAHYLHGIRAPVFEVAYEDLDGLHKAKWFNALLGFLGLIEEINQESDTIKVGARLCEDRIDGLGTNDYGALAGLESRVECYRLRREGNNASSLAVFLPPRKDRCLLAPRDVACPSQLEKAKITRMAKVKRMAMVKRIPPK
jgi:hypothetical protein